MSMSKRSAETRSTKRRRCPPETRAALVDAAAAEFNDFGYDGTNTNKIAMRAGFAPQTFYRHFDQKIDIFIAVYDRWAEEGMSAYDDLRGTKATIRFAIAHHRKYLNFRRALRHLSVLEPKVRRARSASRLLQVERIKARLPHLADIGVPTVLANLLVTERLLDAVAEGEFADLGLSEPEAEQELIRVMKFTFGAEREPHGS